MTALFLPGRRKRTYTLPFPRETVFSTPASGLYIEMGRMPALFKRQSSTSSASSA